MLVKFWSAKETVLERTIRPSQKFKGIIGN
jgi:hypothetical protein